FFLLFFFFFFFSSRRRHTRSYGDWSSDVCSSDLSTYLNASAYTHSLKSGQGLRCAPFVLAAMSFLHPILLFHNWFSRRSWTAVWNIAVHWSGLSELFGAATGRRMLKMNFRWPAQCPAAVLSRGEFFASLSCRA